MKKNYSPFAQLLFATLLSCLAFSALAQNQFEYIHKRIPFHHELKENEWLLVEYDFTGKQGIRCTGKSHQIDIEFFYKGRKKFARLPVSLSNTLPDRPQEELADLQGQLTLAIAHPSPEHLTYLVRCDYIEN